MENYENLVLTWEPWIGKEYENGGIFNKKILILGESHYGTEKDKWFDKNLTKLTIQEKIGEAPNDSHFHKKAFHTNIFRALNDLPSSKENLIRFWHSVVFFNYVQDSVGERARIRPKEELWELSYESVKKTLDILKPEIIIVLGYKLWDSINYKFKPFEVIQADFNNFRNVHQLEYGNKPLMFCIKHPSSGFSSNYFRPHILKYIK